ncbi:MAG: ParB/RepB/Spo0J family partition protein [Gammaproteobacteria bacterium]|nr:ParB/RepB/Spo0J family partition protein [Gammaproteobacteria bacterium]
MTMQRLELNGLSELKTLSSLESSPDQFTKETLQQIAIEHIEPGPYQPRQQMDQQALEELANSIKKQGLIQPIIVQPKSDTHHYFIVAGERRWRAAQLAGLKTVPVIIKIIDEKVALAFALIENLQREDLNPIDKAEAFIRFQEEYEMTHTEIAETVGLSRTAVTNMMRLLGLAQEVKALLRQDQLQMGHGRALLSLSSDQQVDVAKQVIRKSLSVRATENLVNRIKPSDSEKDNSKILNINTIDSGMYQQWLEQLSKTLPQNTVRLTFDKTGKGKIIITVDSPKAIEEFIQRLQE